MGYQTKWLIGCFFLIAVCDMFIKVYTLGIQYYVLMHPIIWWEDPFLFKVVVLPMLIAIGSVLLC